MLQGDIASEVGGLGAQSRALSSLDFVGLGLTILGLVLALFALGSYSVVRGAAMDAASDEARETMLKWLDENSSTLVDSKVISEILETERSIRTLANEVEKRISKGKSDPINDNDADLMANAFDDGEEQND